MKLLQIEWIKLRGHNFFWIGMGLYILSMILLITQFGAITINQQGDEGNPMQLNFGEAGFYKLPYLWQNITYLAGFFKLIPTFLLILFVANEFQYKTLRQNIIDGLSLGQAYWSKILLAILFAFFSMLLIGLTGLVIAIIYNPEAPLQDYISHIDYLLAFFAEVLFIITFAVALTFILKRSTISIIIILAYYYILEPVVGFILGEPFQYYLPTAPSRELILQPFTRMFEFDSFLGMESPDSLSYRYLFLTLLYSFIFAVAGFLFLKKRDL